MLSRVADSLYWIGRYLERTEHTARLLDVNLSLMLDQTPAAAERRWERMQTYLAWNYEGIPQTYALVQALTFDVSNASSLVSGIGAARENARQVREQISSEMWEQLNRVYLQVKRTTMDQMWQEPHEFLHNVLKEGIHLFQGITTATLSHGECWHWLRLGQFMERAMATAILLDVHFAETGGKPDDQTNYLDWVGLLKSCTSFEAYCNVYTADIRPERIAEFLLLNAESPRSVRFAADQVAASIQAIAANTVGRRGDRVKRLAGRLQASLDYGQVDEIMADGLSGYLATIQQQCQQIHTNVYQTFISYPVETALV
ncbi:MAG: alpha-E domain-containing protein [Chloroflexi bacterium]|nr:alpha-E domain-containing protein [Chloroflexota bacterium]